MVNEKKTNLQFTTNTYMNSEAKKDNLYLLTIKVYSQKEYIDLFVIDNGAFDETSKEHILFSFPP